MTTASVPSAARRLTGVSETRDTLPTGLLETPHAVQALPSISVGERGVVGELERHRTSLGQMLVVRQSVQDQMIAHALRGLPHEACGLFVAEKESGDVSHFFAMRNAARSSEIYQLDGSEMMKVEKAADDAGLQVVGVMHSHTHTTAYPSPTDVADAATFDPFGAWVYIIVSLKDAVPVMRAYRFDDGDISEVELVVALAQR